MQFVKAYIVLVVSFSTAACLPNNFGQRFKIPIGAPLFSDNTEFETGNSNPKGRQGRWQRFASDSHRLVATLNYLNDELHGEYIEYDLLNRMSYQVDYQNGTKNGWESKRKRDGEISRCRIKAGTLDGPCYRSYGEQDEYLSGTYKNGIKVGAFICYHKDGRIKVKGFYKDGKQEGIWKITPRDANNDSGYKNYHYSAGIRTKIVYPKLGTVDNNPSQIKFHKKN